MIRSKTWATTLVPSTILAILAFYIGQWLAGIFFAMYGFYQCALYLKIRADANNHKRRRIQEKAEAKLCKGK